MLTKGPACAVTLNAYRQPFKLLLAVEENKV
jgi:hypothetical protein